MIYKKDYNSYGAFGIQIVSVFQKKKNIYLSVYLAALSLFFFFFVLSLNCDSGSSLQLLGFSGCSTWA